MLRWEDEGTEGQRDRLRLGPVLHCGGPEPSGQTFPTLPGPWGHSGLGSALTHALACWLFGASQTRPPLSGGQRQMRPKGAGTGSRSGLCACCGLGQPPTQEPLLPPVQPGVDPPVRRPLWVQPSLLLSLRCSVWTAALPWVHLLITYSLNKHKCCGPAPSLVPEAEMEAILSSGTLGLCAQPRL